MFKLFPCLHTAVFVLICVAAWATLLIADSCSCLAAQAASETTQEKVKTQPLEEEQTDAEQAETEQAEDAAEDSADTEEEIIEPVVMDPWAKQDADFLRQLQSHAIKYDRAIWGDEVWAHWGHHPTQYSNWTNHSNRLIPVYTWGVLLDSIQGENSIYRDAARLEKLFGALPKKTLNPKADYFDQTDIYGLQKQALDAGKKNVILLVFDGMDWQTTRAAAIYKNKAIQYQRGRGKGLAFQDYGRSKANIVRDFGYMVTTPHNGSTKIDTNVQMLTKSGELSGGYSAKFGGARPWSKPASPTYLLNKLRSCKHTYTDSAASATSMTAGIKTFNGSINISPAGEQVKPIAHDFQEQGYAVGVVSSVSLSHATPAAAYAHNVTRDDYQDLTRDLLGLKSVSHRVKPLKGVDVLIGGGWGESKNDDRENQGFNYIPGNRYLSSLDLKDVDIETGGKYLVAQRTKGKKGRDVLMTGAKRAAKEGHRFFGYFGAMGAHLPYRTGDGDFLPPRGESKIETYTPDDVAENPTLADMTEAALAVLETNISKSKEKGFWLMVESGDVDWGNHANNIDNSIGAVLSGESAFNAITDWVDQNSNWDETVLIVTADHGHMLVLVQPEALTGAVPPTPTRSYPTKLEQKKAKEKAAKEKKAKKAEEKAKKAKEEKAKAQKMKKDDAERNQDKRNQESEDRK